MKFQNKPSDSTSIVKAVSVSRKYLMGALEYPALREINFNLNRNDFSAIAGPSGSGKSTLLNILGCLDRPSSGDVFIEGISTRELSLSELADFRSQKLGFIFQTFNLIPTLSALENVEYPLLLQKLPSKLRKKMAEESLVKVGLEKFFHFRPGQLSGGQRQRVAIARAIVKKPILILADEPTANLDHRTSLEILALMQHLNREEQMSVLFSSHDPEVLKRASTVTYLMDGVTMREGNVSHVA